jgi:hypothetical protein
VSAQVTAEFFAQPGRGEDVAKLLLDDLGESLTFEGCEADSLGVGERP